MLTIKSLNLEFSRVLIESKYTKLASNFDQSILNKIKVKIGKNCSISNFIIVSYLNDSFWLVITLSSIYWANNGETYSLSVKDLKEAKLDLYINKKLGFNPDCGFKYLTLVSKDGLEYNVETEPGSSLEAILAVITRLITESSRAR